MHVHAALPVFLSSACLGGWDSVVSVDQRVVMCHPPLTDDELLPRGSQAAISWATSRSFHSIVLCCLWLLWCDPVWPLHTRGSRDSVGIISGPWNPWNPLDKKGIDDLLCKRCV